MSCSWVLLASVLISLWNWLDLVLPVQLQRSINLANTVESLLFVVQGIMVVMALSRLVIFITLVISQLFVTQSVLPNLFIMVW
nr:hypothetical protein Iba_chr09cCG13900 [Ipomoea batatas]